MSLLTSVKVLDNFSVQSRTKISNAGKPIFPRLWYSSLRGNTLRQHSGYSGVHQQEKFLLKCLIFVKHSIRVEIPFHEVSERLSFCCTHGVNTRHYAKQCCTQNNASVLKHIMHSVSSYCFTWTTTYLIIPKSTGQNNTTMNSVRFQGNSVEAAPQP